MNEGPWDALRKILDLSDLEMADGDGARDIAKSALLAAGTEGLRVDDVLAWMKARPGVSWIATIDDIE